MASRFDYPDPGTDPRYCDGLSADPDGPFCLWCNDPLPDQSAEPYCSVLCACYADLDSAEDSHD